MSSVSILPFDTNWLAPRETLGYSVFGEPNQLLTQSIYPEIERTWPNAKCTGRKYFDLWNYVVTCATLEEIFSSQSKAINVFAKHSEIKSMWPINSSKEEIVLSHDSKELFVQHESFWWK